MAQLLNGLIIREYFAEANTFIIYPQPEGRGNEVELEFVEF